MGKLLEQALTPESINLAWRRLHNDLTPWRPGMERDELTRNLLLHVQKLVEELRAGRYRPDNLRRFPIAKASGGVRILSALTLRDKLAQRLVLNVLQPLGEALFHNDSYGYRPHRNTAMALRRARELIRCGLHWLLDADIRGFFDNIPHKTLIAALKAQIPDRDLLRLMESWLEVGPSQQSILGTRRGIPQGGILSPFWCNLYLHGLDEHLQRHNLPFVRFADDFLVLTAERQSAERTRELVERQLRRMGLELHSEKTRVVQASAQVRFLGEPLLTDRK